MTVFSLNIVALHLVGALLYYVECNLYCTVMDNIDLFC